MRTNNKDFEIGKLGIALCLLGLLGFLLAGYFNIARNTIKETIKPIPANQFNSQTTHSDGRPQYRIGPIEVKEPYTAFEISTSTNLWANHWTFVEVVVEDQLGNYLFYESSGKIF